MIYNELRRAGVGVGFVDLEQIGFLRPTSADDPANHRLKAANLAAMWDTYSASGAERLIVCGPITAREDLRPYVAALHETSLRFVDSGPTPATSGTGSPVALRAADPDWPATD